MRPNHLLSGLKLDYCMKYYPDMRRDMFLYITKGFAPRETKGQKTAA
jgi:hypothetical protein